jgi:hypothetical protein
MKMIHQGLGRGSAGFTTGFGVYDDPAMLKDREPQGIILQGLMASGQNLTVKGENIAQFLALDWGYDISAA